MSWPKSTALSGRKIIIVEFTTLKNRPKGIYTISIKLQKSTIFIELFLVFKEWDMTIVVNLKIFFNYHVAFWPVDPGTCQEGFRRICSVC